MSTIFPREEKAEQIFDEILKKAAAKTVPGMSVPAPSLSSADGIAAITVYLIFSGILF